VETGLVRKLAGVSIPGKHRFFEKKSADEDHIVLIYEKPERSLLKMNDMNLIGTNFVWSWRESNSRPDKAS
jgi:hypothetical protein